MPGSYRAIRLRSTVEGHPLEHAWQETAEDVAALFTLEIGDVLDGTDDANLVARRVEVNLAL